MTAEEGVRDADHPGIRPGRRWWLRSGAAPAAIVALLVAGALIGAVAWDVVDDEDAESRVTAEVTTTTTAPDGADDVVVGARAVCIDALERSVEALELVDAGVTALGELSRDELERTLDRLDELRPELRRSVDACNGVLRE